MYHFLELEATPTARLGTNPRNEDVACGAVGEVLGFGGGIQRHLA